MAGREADVGLAPGAEVPNNFMIALISAAVSR